MGFSLERFEYSVYSHQHEVAARELMALLSALDANYGLIGNDFISNPVSSIHSEEVDQHVLARISSAVACLFSDVSFQFSPEWQNQIFNWHRWLSAILSSSPLRNGDQLLRALSIRGEGALNEIEVANKDLVKFCMLFAPESEVPLDLEALWNHDKALTARLCLALLSPRFLGSPIAHSKREKILPWFSKKLMEIKDLSVLPSGILHDVYMHCSYADNPKKHDIKRPINALVQKKLKEAGIYPVYSVAKLSKNKKPTLLVVVEWFNVNHSIYRTHSRTIEAARALFHVIGMGLPSSVDAAGRAVFDEFYEIADGDFLDQLKQVRQKSISESAQILYMPSVGMFPLTVYLSNMGIAPLQMMALGHPATSHSAAIDYIIVEEDYVGDPACFSEKLLRLPFDGMPYRPSGEAAALQLESVYRDNPEVVRIAIASTPMKLNPNFLSACADIINQAPVKIHLHMLIGQAQGLLLLQIRRVVRQFLGEHATVYPHQAYADYMRTIASCDMFINPFPFGNTNGIIDTVTAGLVGVCKTGREVHEHIDEGLFSRLGFPEWTITHTKDEYVASAIRMATHHEERNNLRKALAGLEGVNKLFQGRPEIMGQIFMQILKQKAASAAGNANETAAVVDEINA